MAVIIPTLEWQNDNGANEKSSAISTLSGYPEEITLSDNIRNFTLSPVLTGNTPLLAFGGFAIMNYVPVGTVITIESELASMTLTASATPSVGEFYTESATINTVEYREMVAESIADTINQSIAFNSNYDVNMTSTLVRVDAKSHGDDYNFTLTSSDTSIIFVLQVNVNEFESQNKIDYSCFVNAYVGSECYGDTIDKQSGTLIGEYRVNSNELDSNIDINAPADFVEPILPVKSLYPSWDFSTLPDMGLYLRGSDYDTTDNYGNERRVLTPYYLVYGDAYRYVTNGQKKKHVKGVSPVRWCQHGSYDKLLPYNMTDYVWIPSVIKEFKWLTSSPQRKSVTYDSHEYLQAIIKKTNQDYNFRMEYTLTWLDGTSYTDNNDKEFSYKDLCGNISFDVSPVNLNIRGLESTYGKLCKEYSVRLVWEVNNSTKAYSEARTYVIDRNCYTHKQEVIFCNEFGGWDALEFLGEVQEEIEKSSISVERGLPSLANKPDNYSISRAANTEVTLNVSSDVRSTFSIHTGLMSEQHYSWAKKIIESSAVYIWDNELKEYRSIIITDNDYNFNTMTEGGSLSISFMYTTSNNSANR